MRRAKNVEKVVICMDVDRYLYEACIAKLNNGDLLAVFTEGRERAHTDFDSISVIRSRDNGRTWDPLTKMTVWSCTDHMGATDPAITCLSDGTVLIHFVIVSFLEKKGILEDMGPQSENFTRGLKCWEGIFLSKSTDDGHTWGSIYKVNTAPLRYGYATDSVVELPDGVLLMASQGNLRMPPVAPPSFVEPDRSYLLRSDDGGDNWEHFSTIAFDAAGIISFIEPGICRTADGTLVCLMRTRHQPRDRHQHLWIVYSKNDGESWSRPEPTNIWGYPADLVLLQDGRMLCTYGYRRPPWGLRGCISDDGLDWDVANEFVICEGGVAAPHVKSWWHIGYPCTMQLGGGRLLTVHHEWTQEEPYVQIVVGYHYEFDD